MFRQTFTLGIALVFSCAAAAAADTSLKDILTRPPVIDRKVPVTSVPIKVRAGKLFIEATANAGKRQFVFDTGSPTILTRTFADSLGLTYVGQNTGVDANGEKVTMDIAILDSLTIGDVEFRQVPVLVFDFSAAPIATCIFDGGVIGSEIFPGSVWRIDTEEGRLTIAKDAKSMRLKRPFLRTKLHDFGYPHAPIVDYKIATITDKALFDTGSAAEISLFSGVYAAPPVQATLVPGTLKTGRGSEGTSAGGAGTTTDLARFTVSKIALGNKELVELQGINRSVPPTLLGASLLKSYAISLDYTNGEFILDKRHEAAPSSGQADYAVTMGKEHATVTQLFGGSAAEAAGLRLGDQVIRLQGKSLEANTTADRCEKANWLMDTFNARDAAEIVVLREGAPETLQIPASR